MNHNFRLALMHIKLITNPQKYIVHSLAGFRFCRERSLAKAASGHDVRRLHVDVLEVKIPIRCNHYCDLNKIGERTELKNPVGPQDAK